MKGMSHLVHLIILFVISLFVAAAVITIAGSAAENADGPTTDTIGALSGVSSGDRLYCKIHCPYPETDCDVPASKLEMCTAIAGFPADWGPGTPGGSSSSGTGSSTEYASFDGFFVPNGLVYVTLPDSLKIKYNPSKTQEWLIKIVSSTGKVVGECAMTDVVKTSDGTLCGFPTVAKIESQKIQIRLPYERTKNNIETKIKEGRSYKILFLLFEEDKDVEDDSGSPNLFSLKLGQKIYDKGVGITTVIGLKDISWSCPQPQILEGRYYPEEKIVFTFPTEGMYSWVLMEGYDGGKKPLEVGTRLGTTYPACDEFKIFPTCNPKVSSVGENYEFTMPYTESGKEVAISYPVYAQGKNIKYTDKDSNVINQAPMCRSGKQGYVYTCPATICYTDGLGTFILSSPGAGIFKPNPACKYEIKQEQCPLGCTMLLSNKAECSLPKPDMINAYMAVSFDGKTWVVEKELNPATGKYDLKNEFFHVTTGYAKKRVFVAIKNTATEIKAGEPKIRAKNLDVTAFFDSAEVVVSPGPVLHYKSDTKVLDKEPTDDSALLPGDIFEYEIILDGLGEGLGGLGPHTVTMEVSAVGNFDLGPPAKFSADTNTARSYSYTVYFVACKDCSWNTQAQCESCDGRCVWNPVAPASAACSMK
ncbi:MAG: hypothetical protein KAJ24_03675 [Candidatus Aenigmarchaeota archaeon]|nr:hypothetical protein [Candidatus Aenigmarchaeota archaeon]